MVFINSQSKILKQMINLIFLWKSNFLIWIPYYKEKQIFIYCYMKLRVNEIALALNVDVSDVIAVCTILELPVTSRISSLTIQDAKKITDYYENNK